LVDGTKWKDETYRREQGIVMTAARDAIRMRAFHAFKADLQMEEWWIPGALYRPAR